MKQPGRLRGLERLCWGVALVCGLASGMAWQQARAAATLPPSEFAPAGAATAAAASNPVLGELSIPSLGLRVPVLDDDDTISLLRGVGHIRGTAMPGGLGTMALAGHRDTFMRPLAHIAPRAEIDVTRGPLLYRYRVDRTEIVHPEQVDVLSTEDRPELVLVTCYPFHYVGAAPLRFIVYAHLLSLTPQQR